MNQQINLLSDEKLAQIAAGKMWDFHGGIHPVQNKQQSNQSPISDAGIPAELIIAVEQKGHVPELLVKVGDTVLKGQPLTKVYGALVVHHASSSGVVKAIEPRTDCHPSGLAALSIVIETDGLDRLFSYRGFDNYLNEIPATLVEAIQQAGIVGLGGASFPSHLKLAHIENRLLVINAIECEPYITADDRLIQEHADEIIEGILILQHILKPKLTIFAIEDNKPEAIQAFTNSLKSLSKAARDNILIKIIPTRYPSGSAKQLIEVLTGEQTPIGKHSSELGIVMNNVGTVFAIKEAILDGKPLVSRIVTLTGDAFEEQGNARVRLGTPIDHLLTSYRLHQDKQQKLIIGGPMMGFTVSDTSMPVTSTSNCILAPTIEEAPAPEPEMSCIRCSECAEACPVELLPQQLLWYSQSEDHQKLEEYDLSACIECGACAFVCPSHIPLVEYYRVSKAQIKNTKQEAEKATLARQRHEDREQRLENEKLQRQLKHKLAAEKRQQQMKEKNGGEDLVAAALARAKAKKQSNAGTDATANNEPKPTGQSSQVAAAIARAKAKKLAAASAKESDASSTEGSIDDSNATASPPADPRKAAIAAAVARAKAKKLAAQGDTEKSEPAVDNVELGVSESDTTAADPRKAAIAAAVARAKAKKLAAQGDIKQSESTEDSTGSNVSESDASATDPRKAAIAAAVARAKAKKLAAQGDTEQSESESTVDSTKSDASESDATAVDPRKAAIAAAVARAKAKKLAAQGGTEQSESTVDSTKSDASESDVNKSNAAVADPKKAAIAAAVARAKAKKLAAQGDNKQSESESTVDNAESDVSEEDATAVDPRKAAIAATVARAKAKKLAASAKPNESKNENAEVNKQQGQASPAEPDNRDVIKQRAIRKEQARLHKQTLLAETTVTDEANKMDEVIQVAEMNGTVQVAEVAYQQPIASSNSSDDKKAKIAAVIAKAKAKKLAQKDQ